MELDKVVKTMSSAINLAKKGHSLKEINKKKVQTKLRKAVRRVSGEE